MHVEMLACMPKTNSYMYVENGAHINSPELDFASSPRLAHLALSSFVRIVRSFVLHLLVTRTK